MTHKPVKAVDMRATMPQTAAWVTDKRAAWGVEHVGQCIRQGMAGVPGHFYAMEAGHVVGTPWPAGTQVDEYQRMAVLTGCAFAGFMREPAPLAEGGAHAAH